jgi:arylsulfatase A-like enzyme
MNGIAEHTIRRGLRRVALFAGLAALLAGADGVRGQSPAGRKPNIIFILGDDLGYGDVGCYGQLQRKAQGLPAIDTPQIDRLAQEGIRFTQCYSGHNVCAPSRCSLMTGYHTGHTRVRQNFAPGSVRVPLLDSDITVAEVLKPAGYYTALIGKWGLGDETPDQESGVPNRQGFDYFFGFLDQADAHNHYPDYLWENRTHVFVGQQYANDLFTAKALTFLDEHAAEPFFLYMAYTLPHGPHVVPDYGQYASKPWTDEEKAYAAMVTRMDSGIGQIMTRLQSLGLDRNTIVFFCSDNGPTTEVTLFDSNGPLRGGKTEFYEGGIRVPMIARWPNTIPAGAVSQESWAFWDVMPTFAEIAGVSAPAGIDGVSALAAVMGEPQQSRDHLYWEDPGGTLEQSVRLGDFKAIRKINQFFELYDLSNDLGEMTNVVAQNPLVVARIEQIMGTDRTESDDWPKPPYCSGGASLDGVTLVGYAGGTSAPQCASLTFAQQQVSVYTDSSRPIVAGGLPSAYAGGVLVQLSNSDLTNSVAEFLKLFAAHDATVAVAYRSNAAKPSWWLTDYSATGQTITVGGFSGGNRTFDVRTRNVPAGTAVTLPGNYAEGGNGDASYFVIVQKRLTATTPPSIGMQPRTQTIKLGGAVSFSVVGCGTAPLSYRWEKSSSGGGWSPIGGANASSYAISSVSTSNQGAYRCVVSNAYGEAASTAAVLTVVPQVTPVSTLVGHWMFDESSGSVAIDSSMNGRDGTLSGPTRTFSCISGGALSFDGIDDQVLVNYEGITGANARSVCFWANTSNASGHPVVAWGDEQVPGGKWHVVINGDSSRGVVGAIGVDVGGGHLVGATNVADGRWHQVSIVLGGADVSDTGVYIDGRLDGTSGRQPRPVNTVSNGRRVTVGAGSDGSSVKYFAGLIDDFRLYSGTMSEQKIAALASPPPAISGDYDHDCDVDQTDFGHVQSCVVGNAKFYAAGCEDADFDTDLDVDQQDVAAFLGCLSGPDVPADPQCAE